MMRSRAEVVDSPVFRGRLQVSLAKSIFYIVEFVGIFNTEKGTNGYCLPPARPLPQPHIGLHAQTLTSFAVSGFRLPVNVLAREHTKKPISI